MRHFKKLESIDEFFRLAKKAGGETRAITERYEPVAPTVYKFESTVDEFLTGQVYSCRHVNAKGTKFKMWESGKAHPILLRDLVNDKNLVEQMLEEKDKLPSVNQSPIQIVTLHCSECDRRMVVDGNHRLVMLGDKERHKANLDVLELSGSNWPDDTPDFNLACACITQRREADLRA